MKILVDTRDNRVLDTFADTDTISIETNRVVTPNVIYADLGTATATVYENTTPPTEDARRYTYDGATFTDTWPYRPLSKVEFLGALQAAAGITDAQLVAARDDANLAAFWLKFSFADEIERDNAVTATGLDALVATGYLGAAGKQAVLDTWPRHRG